MSIKIEVTKAGEIFFLIIFKRLYQPIMNLKPILMSFLCFINFTFNTMVRKYLFTSSQDKKQYLEFLNLN